MIVMASFMSLAFMLVFHKSKCIIVSIYPRILVFFHVLVCSLLLRCMSKSSVACGSEGVTQYYAFQKLMVKFC